jgi:alkyl hydroperoxide reductase subunit AhpC
MIRVGQKALDFEAPAYYNGEFTSIKLSDYLGKWVALCFYPGDFTFVWATEISAVAEKNEEFEKLGAQVLSMSTDSMFVHKMWVDNELSKMTSSGTIPYPMMSDGGGKIGEVFGVYDENAGVDVRGRFLIDPDGIVQGFEVLTPPVGRNVSETLRQIQAFQVVRNSKGTEATPSGWRPGKDTLKPGPELVGKVWESWTVDKAFD